MEKSPISRRAALRGLAGAAAVTALARSSAQAPAAPASSGGAIRQSVCRWCFRNTPLDQLAAASKEIGLESVELLNPGEFETVKKAGLTCAMVMAPSGKTADGTSVGGILKAWNRLEYHDTLVDIYRKHLAATAAAGFPSLICFSGNRDGMSDEQGLENCAIGLKRILPEAEKLGVTLVMELLNSKVNHKDYMCDRTPWGVELVKRIGSERFKLLYDIYHMQIMEGDVIRTIRENHPYIAHYHTAGNPGRNEFAPSDVQELNYPAIMRAIKATGYKGFVGQEFVPTRDPLPALREAYQICNV